MKKNKIAIIATILCASCSSLTPQQQAVLQGVESVALSAGIGFLQGGTGGAVASGTTAAISALQAGTLGLRSLQSPTNTTPPTASTVKAAVTTASGSPALGAKVAAIVPAIQAKVAAVTPAGTTPRPEAINAVLEAAAKGLDQAAVAGAKK